MGNKYNSMCCIRNMGLPTVRFCGFTFDQVWTQEVQSFSEELLSINGMFGVRTELAEGNNPLGHFPHGFPIFSMEMARNFVRSHGSSLFYIFNEGIPIERLIYNAVVYLEDIFGRIKLGGEINYKSKSCLRDAMKDTENLINISTICNSDVVKLRQRLLYDAGLVHGEVAEVSYFHGINNGPNRMIFWEIRYTCQSLVNSAK